VKALNDKFEAETRMCTNIRQQLRQEEEQWEKERKLLKQIEDIGRTERDELRTKWQQERQKVIDVELEHKKLTNEMVQQQKKDQSQISSLKLQVQELEKKFSGGTSSADSEELRSELAKQKKLTAEANTRIGQLESQIRELGTYNAELAGRLLGRVRDEDDDDDLEEIFPSKDPCPPPKHVANPPPSATNAANPPPPPTNAAIPPPPPRNAASGTSPSPPGLAPRPPPGPSKGA